MKIQSAKTLGKNDHTLVITGPKTAWTRSGLSKEQIYTARSAFANDQELIAFPSPSGLTLVASKGSSKSGAAAHEHLRRIGNDAAECLNQHKIDSVSIVDLSKESAARDVAEGMALGSYQFLKYRSNGDGCNTLKRIRIQSDSITAAALKDLKVVVNATYKTRDLVNEPLSYLTAVQFSKEMRKMGREAGFKVQVLQKKKIQELGMGGLLAVNLGSPEPPTFTIMEWKPEKARNKKPVVLVGKGVVYDTGGLSLKPTKNSMDFMKCDMGGGAAVAGALYAIASAKLPVHVIGLVPATDNRPGGNAYVPGDVITMYSGKTVEVLNTDAEGRLCMADALHWAKRYKPELVIDLATLTGSAAAAIGIHGMVGMGNAPENTLKSLQQAGESVRERVVNFPFWEEYGEEIKSDIADIKNIGSAGAGGAITAGKFLEHFTDYPWIHIDLAGPAWLHAQDSYRTKGGSGVGTRLLYRFFENYGR